MHALQAVGGSTAKIAAETVQGNKTAPRSSLSSWRSASVKIKPLVVMRRKATDTDLELLERDVLAKLML